MFLNLKEENENKPLERKFIEHSKQMEKFVNEFIAPELIAFYIASGYNHSALYEQQLDRFISTGREFLNFNIPISKKLTHNVKLILEIKYGLKVIKSIPLKLEECYKKITK